MDYIQDSLFGRMSQEHLAATTDEILGRSLVNSSGAKFQCLLLDDGLMPVWLEGTGVVLRGECSTRNIGESPNVAVESSLSQILEANVPQKYYLSAKACAGILRRAEARGKELPGVLREALDACCRSTSGVGKAAQCRKLTPTA